MTLWSGTEWGFLFLFLFFNLELLSVSFLLFFIYFLLL